MAVFLVFLCKAFDLSIYNKIKQDTHHLLILPQECRLRQPAAITELNADGSNTADLITEELGKTEIPTFGGKKPVSEDPAKTAEGIP